VFDDVVRRISTMTRPARVLDIGPGAGKYGRIMREIDRKTATLTSLTCVEIDKKRVIEAFSLEKIYDKVINEDAAKLIRNIPEITGDVAIMGDVIEHLTKSEGRDLLEFLQYRFKHVILVIPVDYLSLSWIGPDGTNHAQEAHVSIWLPSDFSSMRGAYCVERPADEFRFLLCVVNGIRLKPSDHLVVKNADPAEPLEKEAFCAVSSQHGIQFGYLNRS
jgi:hypothetical protein